MKITTFIICILLFSCNNNASNHKNRPTPTDSVSIMNAILRYQEINNIVKKTDTVFVIRNETLPRPRVLDYHNIGVVEVIDKPEGYPKFDEFNYDRFQISFEQLNIHKDVADCKILIKTIGLLGEFKLHKRNKRWVVVSYSQNMI